MQLTPQTILRRPGDLRLQVDSTNAVRIALGDRDLLLGAQALPVLSVFCHATAVGAALERLRPFVQGAQDWLDLTSAIVQPWKAGVLREVGREPEPILDSTTEFDSGPIHVAMLNDRERTAKFLAAIQDVVRPGSVVVDIGTGTGVLAVAAARAGARRVYAVEAGGIERTARAVFQANDVADRITLIPGWSYQVSLPERADVLVSETVGSDPFSEQILETAVDARKRYLQPDARLIPGRVRIFGLALTLPPEKLSQVAPSPDNLCKWRSWYGIDFKPFAQAAKRSAYHIYTRPANAVDWDFLSGPVLLADVDLSSAADLVIQRKASGTATKDGKLDGVLVFFELQLTPNVGLSTDPRTALADCSWTNMVWVFLDPLELKRGDGFLITYGYRNSAARRYLTVAHAS